MTLEVAPLEAWETRFRRLLPEQRDRLETPEFLRLLQQHVTREAAIGDGVSTGIEMQISGARIAPRMGVL